ncbi:hypothetical protein LIER_04347 [Lithospermum erythrorhizon]|uniref:Retrovirus-related Pol polyprotein from transposon TNT 1-94-like beta-barrel domain-containing protein n=1 Tax=Lithospermum erythrorhizon TaxID=34254 RepID=A0AAV3NWG1_LITER
MGIEFNDELQGENNVAIVDHSHDLIVVDDIGSVCFASEEDEWIIGSEASLHVTPHKKSFYNYTEGDYGEAKMGNQGVSKVVAVGDVHLLTDQGQIIVLKSVRYNPDFRMNLMSSDKLDDDGYYNLFGNGQWKLLSKSKVIALGSKNCTLSKLVAKKNYVCTVESNVDLWHKRHGH